MRAGRAFWRCLATVDTETAAVLVGEPSPPIPLARILAEQGACSSKTMVPLRSRAQGAQASQTALGCGRSLVTLADGLAGSHLSSMGPCAEISDLGRPRRSPSR
jgi:hypothetical protein